MPSSGFWVPAEGVSDTLDKTPLFGLFIKELDVMMSYSSLAELLRRSALGDPVSKISVALDIPESTLRDWLEFAKQNKLDYETLSSLTPRDFAELRAKNTRPTSRTVQPDWADVLLQSQKPGVTVHFFY